MFPLTSPALALLLSPLVFLVLLQLQPVNASPLPLSRPTGSNSKAWCTPRFSGLVQEIRKTGQPDVVWKAVASKGGAGGAMDGVKAAKLGKSRSAALELEYEWFVENGLEEGVYSITSGASNCLSTPLLPPSLQRTFSPASSSLSCAPSHSFRLLCQSCDAPEDAASSCFVQSDAKGLCVELLPPPTAGASGKAARPHLGWGECAWGKDEGEGWKGREERDKRRERQLWDITPS
ncbi:hypothetical protein JCM8097_006159 [Rhodosporidiobolus ruineniae]